MRWTILPTAIASYRQQSQRRLTDTEILAELRQHIDGAHHVQQERPRQDGCEVWRGPKPRRIRLLARRLPDTIALVSVEPSHRGVPIDHVTMPRRSHDGAKVVALGSQLRKWRERRGLSAGDLAALAGVDPDDVDAAESGQALSWRVLYAITRALRVELVVREVSE